MSQLDLIAQLREGRPVAPFALRERVREIGERATPPRRRFTQRRVLLVLVAAAGAALLATVIVRSNDQTGGVGSAIPTAPPTAEKAADAGPVLAGGIDQRALAPAAAAKATTGGYTIAPTAPAPSGTRAQKYSATLTLRVPNANAVSKTTTRALQITASLGGYPQTVRVNASGKAGEAYIVVKVPRNRVQDAVRRLGALGTIVGENVSIQDLQAGVDQTGRTIARLQAQLATLRAIDPQTDETKQQVTTITARVERLQRAVAATIRSARYATVELRLTTPPAAAAPAAQEDGPLHGLGVAFRWIGIGAVYALALGAPVIALVGLGWLLARGARRRREAKLLSQP